MTCTYKLYIDSINAKVDMIRNFNIKRSNESERSKRGMSGS